MDDHQEPNLDGDGSSYFQRTVVLKDWWLIKCSKGFEGKQFGVSGIEIAASVETRAMRVFKSSPIIKAFDVFTLQASDGICIVLRGFLNKERVVESGFSPEISREFIFGFPPCWEIFCNKCFEGVPFGNDVSTGSSIIDKACCPVLSPCKNTKGNLEDSLAVSRDDKSTVTEMNMVEINNTDGRSGGSREREKKTGRSKSHRRQSKSGGKSAEDERNLELSKVQNTTDVGDHGSEGLYKAKSGDVGKDESEAVDNEENERKFDENKFQNRTKDGDQGSEDLDKAKSSEVENIECEAIDEEAISSVDGCGRKHTGADNIGKVTSTSATEESLNSEQRKGELKVTRTSSHSLFKDLDKSSRLGKKRKLKKIGKTLKSDGNVVEPMNHSGTTKVKSAENKGKLNASKVQKPTTNDGDHGNECLNKAESNVVEKDDCVSINKEGILQIDRCKSHSGTQSVENLTSKNGTKESLILELRKGKLEVTKTSLNSLSKDLNSSTKPTKKGTSMKSKKALESDCHEVEPMNHSGSKIEDAEENLSGEKIKRRIDFDVEVTPDKEAKKPKSNAVTNSLGQKRSRSGRLLVSSLEFWRNQVAVYDLDRNLVQVEEGHGTNSTASKGRSDSRKARR